MRWQRNQAYAEMMLEHLVGLAKEPGWKAYAWGAAKDYAAKNPEDFGDLPERLKERMLKDEGKT